jgi:hypothetical protein
MDADVLDDQLNVIANDILRLEAQVQDAYENEWGDTQFYALANPDRDLEFDAFTNRSAGLIGNLHLKLQTLVQEKKN